MTDETTTDATAEATEETVTTLVPDVVTVHAAYVVVINRDGSLSTTVVTPAGLKPLTVERVANTMDVFEASKDIVDDIEGQMLADRVARRVVAALTPPDETAEAKARIAEALAERTAE
jgi:hypothetical protein